MIDNVLFGYGYIVGALSFYILLKYSNRKKNFAYKFNESTKKLAIAKHRRRQAEQGNIKGALFGKPERTCPPTTTHGNKAKGK